MIKILLADDHSIVRAGLRKILEKESDLQIVEEVENALDVLKFAKKHDCDLIILDINMPGKSGLEVIQDIKKMKPQIKILILSIYPEDSFAINALELGASGYLTKDSTPGELVKAVRRINSGGKYVSESMKDKLVLRIEKEENKILHEKLSKREFEILLLIGEGKTPAQIAEKLNISINTVATYRARILEKMNMHSNAALIHYVIKNNLIE
jgi:two-component system, NarL family, invasion response regulator UvrY